MRKATDPEMGLMVDAHTWWRMGDKSYSPQMSFTNWRKQFDAKVQSLLVGRAISSGRSRAYKELKRQNLVTVATGEHEQEYEGFEDLARLKRLIFYRWMYVARVVSKWVKGI